MTRERSLLWLLIIPLLGCATPRKDALLSREPTAAPRPGSFEEKAITDEAAQVLIEYPVFRLPYPEAERALNKDIEEEIQRILQSYLRERSNAIEGYGDDPSVWDLTINYHVATLEGSLLSYWLSVYSGTGGAHSLGAPGGRTYRLGPDGIEQVRLGDLFLPGVDYRRALAALCLPKLREQGATYALSGEVREDDLLSLVDNFILDNEGLEIVFPAYSVGPYAEGEYYVRLTYQELSALLDPRSLPVFFCSLPSLMNHTGCACCEVS